MNRTILAIAVYVLVLCALTPVSPAVADESHGTSQKAILVTGFNSGIGRKITETLASEGHFVYAGARKQRDIDELNQIENVLAVRLDVTVQEEIDAAVNLIESEGRGLHGIVNNAGVLVTGPLIEIDESEIDFIFNVNVYGPYRVTKAFAPILIASEGRITNISSISGVLSGPLYGAYSMSKHAIEAYTDSLARELDAFDVRVSAIEPGNYQSNISQNRCDRLLASGYDPTTSRFEDLVNGIVDHCKAGAFYEAPEPDAVADAVLHAMFDKHPKEHYLVVPNREEARITIGKAIEELVSLNSNHPFSFGREELVDMLDNVINEQGQID